MDILFTPVEAQLSGGHTIYIEPLPAKPKAVGDFLRLQREVSIGTYTGLDCRTQNDKPGRITEEDMAAFFNPDGPAKLIGMAETNFDPERELGSLLLRAVDLSQAPRTIGTLNLKFGATATPENPASVTLHDIAVSRYFQRRGIGGLLLWAALTAIRPHLDDDDVLRLMVVESNERAKAWYDKLGIFPTGHTDTLEWGERAIKVKREERSALVDQLVEKVAVPCA